MTDAEITLKLATEFMGWKVSRQNEGSTWVDTPDGTILLAGPAYVKSWRPVTDIVDAKEVLDELLKRLHGITIWSDSKGWLIQLVPPNPMIQTFSTLERAICISAIDWMVGN